MLNRTMGGAAALVFAAACGSAVERPAVSTGAAVSLADHFDASPPLMLMEPAGRIARVEHEVKKLPRPHKTFDVDDPVRQRAEVTPLMPALAATFAGIGNAFSGPQGTFTVDSAPPDTNGDVGPSHYIQTVNSDFAIFDKAGTVLYGPVALNTLWSSFGGDCQATNDGDPVVLYDAMADRWIISQFSVTNGTSTHPFYQCVAVSQTGNPLGSWYRYAFSYTSFPDYPKMGVWPDGYYFTFNLFNAAGTSYLGGKVCAYDRARMLQGLSATQQCTDTGVDYGGLLPADLDGARQPPAGAPNPVVALGPTAGTLAVFAYHVDWTTPANTTLSGPTTLTVGAYTEACSATGTCIPQPGTSTQLDSLGDRLMYRLAYRNFGDHEALVVNHAITSGSSTGIRWYELRLANGTPSIFQQGTYAPDATYRWMGSMAMDHAGNIALGYSASSGTVKPEVRYTGRLAGDAAGAMTQGEGTIQTGGGSQTASLTRWGDYSMMGVDPSDDCTFWFTTESLPANGSYNWRTRIASFKFATCAAGNDFSIGATPGSLALESGQQGAVSVSTAIASGSAEPIALAVSGVPAGATASLSPASVNAGAGATLTVSSGSAAPGTYTVTVTGTAASATHAAAISLTITPVVTNLIANGNFETGTLAGWTVTGTASPVASAHGGSFAGRTGSTLPTNGDSALSQSFTAPATGGTLSLWVKVVCPDSVSWDWATVALADETSGVTTALLPKTCTNTNAWTQLNAALTAGHAYTLRLQSHDDNYAGDATYALWDDVSVVAAQPPAGGILNPGFESGLASWTSVGTAAAVATAHTGAGAVRVGGTSPTNGDSSVSQTFTATAGTTALTFWIKVACPDSVAYDWATATLKDNTAGTTRTVLAKTCTNDGTWKQVTASVVAGHGYTLTLVSHDDNYVGDATSTLFDDVGLQ